MASHGARHLFSILSSLCFRGSSLHQEEGCPGLVRLELCCLCSLDVHPLPEECWPGPWT